MSIDYYDQNAVQFIQDTLNVDMQNLYQRFVGYLPENALVMDAGCGSGRDSLAFLKIGFQVEAFDASDEMVKHSQMLTGLDVTKKTFNQISDTSRFDGVWACASLLHVKRDELRDVMKKLVNALKVGGIIYTSFKYGANDREKDGRHFTDMDESALDDLISGLENIYKADVWTTDDARPDRYDKWFNVILQKGKANSITEAHWC